MLETLSKYHSQWISMAVKITGSRENAEDYVQEMYLKLHDKPEPPNIPAYVYMTIRSIFIDETRRAKKLPVYNFISFENSSEHFGTGAESLKFSNNPVDLAVNNIEVDFEEIIQEDIEFSVAKSVYESLPDYKKDILRYSYEDGHREFCRLSGIGLNTVTLIKRNFKNEVWKILTTKTPQEVEEMLKKTVMKLNNPVQNAKRDGLF